MKKTHLLLLILSILLFSSISFAQITREESDEYIYKFITDKGRWGLGLDAHSIFLYTTDSLSNIEGKTTITSYEGEIISMDCPSWVYFISSKVDSIDICRYLFVCRLGSLEHTEGDREFYKSRLVIDIKTKYNFSPKYPDFKNWREMLLPVDNELLDVNNKSEQIYFTNPVMDFLEITFERDYEYIVIFDLEGKQAFKEKSKTHASIQKFDLSHLSKGLYIVSLFNGVEQISSFKIVKK